ncbi:MAG TPA: retropepsin-like aspartic protease, partial [Novosphingobium sp.]
LGRDRLVHARAMIDGTPVDFVVDTGATRTVLSGRDARQVFGQAGGQQIGRIQTFKGYQPLYQGQARTVTLGAVQLHDVPIGLVPDSQVSVLGLDWLALVGPVTLVS